MRDPASERRRINLARTPVNRGIKEGRVDLLRPSWIMRCLRTIAPAAETLNRHRISHLMRSFEHLHTDAPNTNRQRCSTYDADLKGEHRAYK